MILAHGLFVICPSEIPYILGALAGVPMAWLGLKMAVAKWWR